jgi:hypothetical protein
MGNVSLADVFSVGFEGFLSSYGKQPIEHYRAAHAIVNCRTASLGGHLHECDTCGDTVPVYNSCSNRHCPKCQTLARQRWVSNRMAELLPVPYFHVVFTIPHELNPIALRNKKIIYPILLRAAQETLLTLGKNDKWLGASIGFIAVLHTWGQNLMDHPHIHCIVPAGGLSRNGTKWIPCKDLFLFPFPAMKKLFLSKVLDYLKQAVNKGEVTLPGNLADPTTFTLLITLLYKKKWVIYVKQPFAGPAAVVTYLGNYTHRTAISEKRLVALSDTSVSFLYKDYADKSQVKTMTLEPAEFIRRFLMHVLPKGFMRIRHYGFLSSRGRQKLLPQCAEIFASLKKNLETKKEQIKKPWYEFFKERYGKDPRTCKKCGLGVLSRKKIIQPVKLWGNGIMNS